MKHPPYHLRPNKAIDRLLLVDLLRHLMTKGVAAKYRYIGFGGPFLEDLRAIGQAFPGIRMVSLEKNRQTHLRQKRHLSSKGTTLVWNDFRSYLNSDFPDDEPLVVWLDYTDLKFAHFDDFKNLLGRLQLGSIVKITVPVDSSRWVVREADDTDPDVLRRLEEDYVARFNREFGGIMDADITATDELQVDFPSFVQRMFRIAAQQILPAEAGTVFQILCASTYNDVTPMYSLTGIVYERKDAPTLRRTARTWKFANLNWAAPKEIDVPELSLKERLFLEPRLPCSSRSAKGIQRSLGYHIDDSREKSLRKMRNFVEFYSLYPLFSRLEF